MVVVDIPGVGESADLAWGNGKQAHLAEALAFTSNVVSITQNTFAFANTRNVVLGQRQASTPG